MSSDEKATLAAFLARLVTPSQIAQLANVRQGTVNNWCNRHPSFPAPVVVIKGSGTRLFDLDEVVVWIDAHDYDMTKGRYGVAQTTLQVA
jgi:hypothetical protein